MQHLFDINIATKYNVDLAIFLKNMAYWVEYNRANKTNFHDGRYWTYNKIDAFSEIFPYWSARQIERIIKHGVEAGLIMKGCFNKIQYDRTCWYALSDEALKLLNLTIKPNGEMETREWGNGNTQTVVTIPTNKPDNKPYKNSCSSDDEQVIVKKPKKKKPKLSEIEPLRFDEWYKIYPRQQAYGKAKESWVKNKLDEKADIVIEFLKKQIELEYNYTEKQYILMPATWLNQKRWNDEIIDKSPKSKPIQNNQQQIQPKAPLADVSNQSTSFRKSTPIDRKPCPDHLRNW